MSKYVRLKNGTALTLELRPFASGGEGDLYKITNPTSFLNQVVKIYKPEKRTKERESKTEFLAENRPSIQIQDGHHSVIWVNQLIYDNGLFCGFTMPIAKGEKLELLCHPKLSPTLNGDWSKFDFLNSKALELRLKLCFNIAVALFHIHKLDNYVLVDMKPENIIVQPNGLISIIDIDSVAVIKHKKIVFSAPVATPEYTPPEFYKGVSIDRYKVSHSWDRFSMAVIFYRLLCGIHPFTGSCYGQFEKCHGLVDMVQNGLFPNGIRSSYFKVIPPPHKNFNKLNPTVQGLLKRCFDDGFTNPDIRPTPADWCKCLAPQHPIKISRPMPSIQFSFPSHTSSKPISFNPRRTIEIPLINYKNPSLPKGLKAWFNEFLLKSKQYTFVKYVIQKESDLKEKEQKLAHFTYDLQGIINLFEKKQEEILFAENVKMFELKSSYNAELSNIDKMALDLQLKEDDEIKAAESAFNLSIAQIDERIRAAYTKILAKKYEIHEAKKTTLQNSLISLQSQEKSEITNHLDNPLKLLKYRIEDAVIPNFGISTKKSLASVGIITAADFIDISSDGYFLNRIGKWIKADGVAYGRAYDLREWKRNVELKENQIITQIIKQNYVNRYSKINNDLNDLIITFKIEIEPFQLQFKRETAIHDEAKTSANISYSAELKKIKSKFDTYHLELISKAKEYTDFSIIQKLKDISVETEKNLNSNFIHHFTLFDSKIKEINAYTEDFKSEINNLNQLHKQLMSQAII